MLNRDRGRVREKKKNKNHGESERTSIKDKLLQFGSLIIQCRIFTIERLKFLKKFFCVNMSVRTTYDVTSII